MVSYRCMVSGRVQGVFFRDSTRRKAEELGLKGHAINLPDGRVEVVMAGPEDAVAQLKAWLHEGPPMASVTDVSCSPCQAPTREGFRTG